MNSEQRTQFALDKSHYIIGLIKFEHENDHNLLGTYQLSFLTFLLLGNLEGWNYFKNLTILFCESVEIFNLNRNLTNEFLKSFYLILS